MTIEKRLSNGHSHENFVNASTSQIFPILVRTCICKYSLFCFGAVTHQTQNTCQAV